jgi:hypothetical protein
MEVDNNEAKTTRTHSGHLAQNIEPTEWNKTESDTSGNDSSASSASAYMADTTPWVPMTGWILDSGATAHIYKIHSMFTTFTPEQVTVGGINKTGP